MNEAEWVKRMAARIDTEALSHASSLDVKVGHKISYGYEILSYGETPQPNKIEFQTDLAIIETDDGGQWKPRVVIEAKIRNINTHDAITYSQKAASHKAVHPYLRYGIMLGDRKHHPLPGRLYRHGLQFDFMVSFHSTEPTKHEMLTFAHLLQSEVEASRTLEKIIYESRIRNRDHYTILHRRLDLE
jgi:hypothetical protein